MRANNTESRKKILLIDEKSDTSLVVGLEQEGYEVIACKSPQKAWGFVYPIRPDIIVLHLQHLSTKDTYALQECLALADGVPVIIATGASRSEASTKELRQFGPRFLFLPLKPNAVREIFHDLESSTSDRRSGSELRKQF